MLAAALFWIKTNPKRFFQIILVIAIVLMIGAIAGILINVGVNKCEAKHNEEKIAVLENALELEREYLNKVLTAQAKNASFINRQRRATTNAKEADAPCAAVLCNTINRLHNDTGHD